MSINISSVISQGVVASGSSTRKSQDLEGTNTKGTVSVFYKNNEPITLRIEFEPKQPTDFPAINAMRILTIDLKKGNGTLFRDKYETKDLQIIGSATAEFVSDKEKVPGKGLFSAVLAQQSNVRTDGPRYNDLEKNPLLKVYSEGGVEGLKVAIKNFAGK